MEKAKFTVQMAFSGIMVVMINSRKDHDHRPDDVELLLVRDATHIPRLCCRFEDIAKPENTTFENSSVESNGSPIIETHIADRMIEIKAEGGSSKFDARWARNPAAKEPGVSAAEDVLDWIPDIAQDFGAPAIIRPNEHLANQVYATIIKLPPGKLTSRQFLLDPDFSQAKWAFGDQTDPEAQVLSEQVVWTRTGIRSFSINIALPGKKTGALHLELDPAMRRARGLDPFIELSITNLPQKGTSGRFNDPTHFRHFNSILHPSFAPLRKIRRVNPSPGPITSSGACPPVIREITHV